jgi:hypothetical protein
MRRVVLAIMGLCVVQVTLTADHVATVEYLRCEYQVNCGEPADIDNPIKRGTRTMYLNTLPPS